MRQLHTLACLSSSVVLGLLSVTAAQATEGYFLGGYGATQTAVSGAGVANPEDAMSMTLNPANVVGVDRQLDIGMSLFMPDRGYTGTNTQFVAPGSHSSSIPLFLMPNIAYSQPIDSVSAWGIAVYGNGGLNTVYNGVANPGCPAPGGVFCGGKAGVNVMQGFLQADYARSFGSLTVGIAPVIAVQLFGAEGLGAFTPNSADPTRMTNNGTQTSYGVGLHAGVEWRATNALRIGVSGGTPDWMQKFSDYSGLFAGQGSFDIPAFVSAGVAYDVQPNLTLLADYKHIFYSDVPSIGNSSRIMALFGSSGGPGFGWHDIDILALGAEWRFNDKLTLRAGMEFNTSPIGSSDVTMNILAPGVTTSQFSAGGSYRITPNSTIDLAGYYVPRNTVSGPEFAPVPAPGNIAIRLSEAQVTAGWTYHFDAQPAAH